VGALRIDFAVDPVWDTLKRRELSCRLVSTVNGRVLDVRTAPISHWLQVYLLAKKNDGIHLSEHDVRALLRSGDLHPENLLVGYDGRLPTSAAITTYDKGACRVLLSNLVLSPGREDAGVNLVDHVLACARQRGATRVVSWVSPGESRVSNLLGTFLFELRHIRTIMRTIVSGNLDCQHEVITPPDFERLHIEALLHEGALSLRERIETRLAKWRACLQLSLENRNESRLIAFCSQRFRRQAWVLIQDPGAFSPFPVKIDPEDVVSLLASLRARGVKEVYAETGADRNTRTVFEGTGFSVTSTLYRLVFDIAHGSSHAAKS